jgi:hypothetical protein
MRRGEGSATKAKLRRPSLVESGIPEHGAETHVLAARAQGPAS